MLIKEFQNSENIYPERIEGTAEWFYCQIPNCIDPDDLQNEKYDFDGTKLVILNIKGEKFEPIKQQYNVLLSRPYYNIDDNAFSIICYDFNSKTIKLLKYEYLSGSVKNLFEMPMADSGDLINIMVINNSYNLVKYNVMDNTLTTFYPFKSVIKLEENETVNAINNNVYINSKWVEDPDYREEIIIRNIESGQILERKDGYLEIMPNAELWMLTR